jgi:hypothetical protein
MLPLPLATQLALLVFCVLLVIRDRGQSLATAQARVWYPVGSAGLFGVALDPHDNPIVIDAAASGVLILNSSTGVPIGGFTTSPPTSAVLLPWHPTLLALRLTLLYPPYHPVTTHPNNDYTSNWKYRLKARPSSLATL